MNSREFFDLVVAMRRAQKEKMKARLDDRRVAMHAADLERKVDAEIARVQLITHERNCPRLEI